MKTSGPGLLDRVLNEIFERELKAYAQPNPKDSASPSEPIEKQETVDFAQAEEKTESDLTNSPNNARNSWDDAWDWADAEESNNEDEEGECVNPRPWLSIPEAARVLGKSPRAVERCILGRWGNRLPDGWSARKVRIDGNDEWRVVPPSGYRKHSRKATQTRVETYVAQASNRADGEPAQEAEAEDLDFSDLGTTDDTRKSETIKDSARTDEREVERMPNKALEDDMFGSLEKLFTSASKLAQKELASFVKGRKEKTEVFHAPVETIVIDRSDEVEKLLRELAQCQKELAVERRARLEDLKLINEMQSSMRLLEDHCRETKTLKEELVEAQVLLIEHKKQYQEFLQLPWWKRLFHKKQA